MPNPSHMSSGSQSLRQRTTRTTWVFPSRVERAGYGGGLRLLVSSWCFVCLLPSFRNGRALSALPGRSGRRFPQERERWFYEQHRQEVEDSTLRVSVPLRSQSSCRQKARFAFAFAATLRLAAGPSSSSAKYANLPIDIHRLQSCRVCPSLAVPLRLLELAD